MAKVLINASCSCCGKIDQNEIELDTILDAIIKKIPSTKGSIDSIKAIFEKEKHKMLTA